MSKLSADFELKQDDINSRDSNNKKIAQDKSRVATSSVPDKPETLETIPKRSHKSTRTDLNFGITSSTVNYDSRTFLEESSSTRQISTKTTQKFEAPEIFGIGANKNVKIFKYNN